MADGSSNYDYLFKVRYWCFFIEQGLTDLGRLDW